MATSDAWGIIGSLCVGLGATIQIWRAAVSPNSPQTDEELRAFIAKRAFWLGTLNLSHSRVTDAGLKELKGRKNTLRYLLLDGTSITDAGLKELKDLKKLCGLDLGGTAITDAGLKELKDLSRLKLLSLNGTKITAAGLKDLKELKGLEVIYLNETQISDAESKEVLPKVEVIRSNMSDVNSPLHRVSTYFNSSTTWRN